MRVRDQGLAFGALHHLASGKGRATEVRVGFCALVAMAMYAIRTISIGHVFWALEGAALVVLCTASLEVCILASYLGTIKANGIDLMLIASWARVCDARILFGTTLVIICSRTSDVRAKNSSRIVPVGVIRWTDMLVTSVRRFATLLLIDVCARPRLARGG